MKISYPKYSNSSITVLVKGNSKVKFPLISDPEYSWVLYEVIHYTLVFTSKVKFGEFIYSFHICSESLSDFVSAKPCSSSNRVFIKPLLNGEDFTFVHEYFLKYFYISFPLSNFKCRMLMMMNVALSQLHPNSSKFCVIISILSQL